MLVCDERSESFDVVYHGPWRSLLIFFKLVYRDYCDLKSFKNCIIFSKLVCVPHCAGVARHFMYSELRHRRSLPRAAHATDTHMQTATHALERARRTTPLASSAHHPSPLPPLSPEEKQVACFVVEWCSWMASGLYSRAKPIPWKYC